MPSLRWPPPPPLPSALEPIYSPKNASLSVGVYPLPSALYPKRTMHDQPLLGRPRASPSVRRFHRHHPVLWSLYTAPKMPRSRCGVTTTTTAQTTQATVTIVPPQPIQNATLTVATSQITPKTTPPTHIPMSPHPTVIPITQATLPPQAHTTVHPIHNVKSQIYSTASPHITTKAVPRESTTSRFPITNNLSNSPTHMNITQPASNHMRLQHPHMSINPLSEVRPELMINNQTPLSGPIAPIPTDGDADFTFSQIVHSPGMSDAECAALTGELPHYQQYQSMSPIQSWISYH